MSLTVDGVWKAGVWAPTVWADGVWSEGGVRPTPDIGLGGGTYRKLRKKRHAQKLAIEALYAEAVAVPEIQDEAAQIVRPFTKSEAELPKPATVDWQALKRDAEVVAELVKLWMAHIEDMEIEREDEMLLFGIR